MLCPLLALLRRSPIAGPDRLRQRPGDTEAREVVVYTVPASTVTGTSDRRFVPRTATLYARADTAINPLPDVAKDIVKAKGIRPKTTDRCGLSMADGDGRGVSVTSPPISRDRGSIT